METINQDTINHLLQFLYLDKFSPIAWKTRGVTPSNDLLPPVLTGLFNNCAKELIVGLERNYTNKQLKEMMLFSLSTINREDFEADEREFIVDTYIEVAAIVNVNFKVPLNAFLHGPVLGTLMNFKPAVKPARIITQYCTDCKTKLETLILKEDKKEPDYGWNIIQCNRCGEYNLLHLGPGVKAVKFGQYQTIEQLNRQDFTEREAATRLEQVRYYRKR